jgi:hypothetical protein
LDSERAIWLAVTATTETVGEAPASTARWFVLAICSLVALFAVIATVALQNVLLYRYFPVLPRLTTDFSPTYLRRDLRHLASAPPRVVFLGDSVLWGYGITARQTAVTLLVSQGCSCVNLGFKAANPPNYYVLARLFQIYGVRPKYVVIEVNQKVLNSADSYYRTLHPAVADLGAQTLSNQDARLLDAHSHRDGRASFLSALSRYSLLYAMRSDIRETWFGEEASAKRGTPTADQLIGTYDLSPLDDRNVGVHFLIETLDALHAAGVPVLAFTTPTNHKLMRDYINVPEYRSNNAYLLRLIRAHFARALNLDAAFPADEFIDEAHLTSAGQRRLSVVIAKALDLQPPSAHGKD